MQHSSGFTQITEEAKKNIKEIRFSELKKNVYLIDVREKDEFDKGFIPHAIHLSKGIIERDIEKVIPDKTAEIVLYCGGGSRSALAAENLQRMGYNHVFSLMGGYRSFLENK